MTKVFSENLTDQFLMIHNEVIDEIMPFIPPAASNIIFFIYRKTRGWHKRADQISFSQIMEGTGIRSSATVAKHLKLLTELGILVRLKPKDIWEANSYLLNADFDTSTLKNEVGSTLKNEDTKDISKIQENTLTADAANKFSFGKEKLDPPTVFGLDQVEPDTPGQHTNGHAVTASPSPSEFEDHFGPNPRQAEIDKKQPRLSKDELLLQSLGAGVPSPVRSLIGQMRDTRWKVGADIERGIATFAHVTGYPLPTTKRERKQWETGVRQHLDDEMFKGRIGRLYTLAWEKLAPQVKEGVLTVTHPMALTTTMKGIVLAKRPANGQVNADEVLAILRKKGVVEIKPLSNGAGMGYFWTESGEEVVSIPQEYIQMAYSV